MKTIKAFIKSHPLLSFYGLAFAIIWGGLIMVVGGPSEILGTPELLGTRFGLVMLAWLAGPSVAGIFMTGLLHGRAGFRDLFTRMTRWRVGCSLVRRGAPYRAALGDGGTLCALAKLPRVPPHHTHH
jgi:hypothetical protein